MWLNAGWLVPAVIDSCAGSFCERSLGS